MNTETAPFQSAALALHAVRGALDHLHATRSSSELPRAGAECPLCSEVSLLERRALQELLAMLEEDVAARGAYGRGEGLCYDHAALAMTGSGEAPTVVRARLVELLERREQELERLLDALVRGGPTADDLGAWRRSFSALRGIPGRVGPDPV